MDFLAKSGNVNLDEMPAPMARVVVSTPALFEKPRLGYNVTGIIHERGKKPEFDRCQRKRRFSAPNLPRVHIHRQVTDVEPATQGRLAPPQSELDVDCQRVEVVLAWEAEIRTRFENVADFDCVGSDAQKCDQHSRIVIAQMAQEIGWPA
jgi:hypothetical protein